jgi:hypothetical protein
MIELNHLHDGKGNPTLKQWVFWDRDHLNNYQCIGWVLAGKPGQRVKRLGKHWEWTYHKQVPEGNSKAYQLIHVQASEFRETWTQSDPETNNRKVWPVKFRRGLEGPMSVQEMLETVSPKKE